MMFESALGAMRRGRRVRRASWPEGRCVWLVRDVIVVDTPRGIPRDMLAVFVADAVADDWELAR